VELKTGRGLGRSGRRRPLKEPEHGICRLGWEKGGSVLRRMEIQTLSSSPKVSPEGQDCFQGH